MLPRWFFLRALAAIYFSAFYSLLFQIEGLIGPHGIFPAHDYLAAVEQQYPSAKLWFAPTVFWLNSSSQALMLITWIGLLASIVAFVNLWPRLSLFICFVCFLSFVSAAGEFSNYQSDGMLLEAGFIALFFVPRGLMPGLGAPFPPSRASLFLLQWEWFRIYFESGMVKLVSGDRQWRTLTAMDEYYQNGPLPTWIGWYLEHLPHWFHAASAAGTLILELALVWMLFLPRRGRILCFFIVTPWEIGVILTANYTFLNYLVLSLGILLLDDGFLARFVPTRYRTAMASSTVPETKRATEGESADQDRVIDHPDRLVFPRFLRGYPSAVSLALSALMLLWIFYNTTVEMIGIPSRNLPFPMWPIAALEPFRIANQYGLFAVMTNGRYEIEFQGSNDGQNWTAYPFSNKPQALDEAPRIYAPYQPRFDWNLWFASLGEWRQDELVPVTEQRLLENDKDVLTLFRGNPFSQAPPRYVRAVLWQYWFTSRAEKRDTGNWWRRKYLGQYAPELTKTLDGHTAIVQWPDDLPMHD
ncbi:lipase maturation factor family protein [Telmatobacter sp. DSM 110680]|uniref:Lipase maturation factor 2 n=1 Tax=Telmatobacter sp. DSM 110680 TaxID=3036704 RepID=A0AAU7DRL4_9BACT